MSERNKHGLTRDIPSGVKLEVRKRSGFGCVICGSALYTYEHIDPPWAEAKEHRVEGITLLCDRHQRKKTTGFLAAQTVKDAMESPKCLRDGFAWEEFEFGSGNITIRFAGQEIAYTPWPFVIRDTPILVIEPPESIGGPFRLSAVFNDELGKPSLTIIRNEYKVFSGNWDVEARGGTVIVRHQKRHIGLKLKMEPPNRFVVQKIMALYGNVLLVGDPDTLRIVDPKTGKARSLFQGMRISHCPIGIHLA